MDTAVAALNAIESLANNTILLSEAYLLTGFHAILVAAAHKQLKIRQAAESAALTLATKMSPNAVRTVLPALFENAEVGKPWQSRALSLRVIASFGDHAPMQLGNALPMVSFDCCCVCDFLCVFVCFCVCACVHLCLCVYLVYVCV